jgi:hypothetical protein
MKLTLKANDLHTVMSDALAFASTDATIPALNGIRLEFVQRGETVDLIAVATDRFTLGVSRADGSGDILPGFNLAASDAKNIVRIAKTLTRMQSYRTVDVETSDDDLNVMFVFSTGETVTVRKSDHEFPRWRQLFPADDAGMADDVSGIGYTPEYLAKFGKVAASKRNPMQFFPRAMKPGVVMIGDDFMGIIMPVRTPGDTNRGTYATPAWF